MNAHPTAEAEPSAAEAHASGASGSGRRVARGMAWVPWLGTGIDTARQVGAFTLIAFGTLATQRRHATRVIGPMVQAQVARSGVRVLPIICFLGVAIGALIVSQTTLLLVQVGQGNLVGSLLATVVVRELAPLTAALVVLARVGTATVAELGMARAMGEVEALEALGIDPVHYLVVPRLVGMSAAIVCLTGYLVLTALGAGYVVAFARGLSMTPADFAGAVAGALSWVDFPLLALKTAGFGVLTSMIICFHGLARPLRMEEVGDATTRTVAHTVVACVLLDGLFVPVYLAL